MRSRGLASSKCRLLFLEIVKRLVTLVQLIFSDSIPVFSIALEQECPVGIVLDIMLLGHTVGASSILVAHAAFL